MLLVGCGLSISDHDRGPVRMLDFIPGREAEWLVIVPYLLFKLF